MYHTGDPAPAIAFQHESGIFQSNPSTTAVAIDTGPGGGLLPPAGRMDQDHSASLRLQDSGAPLSSSRQPPRKFTRAQVVSRAHVFSCILSQLKALGLMKIGV